MHKRPPSSSQQNQRRHIRPSSVQAQRVAEVRRRRKRKQCLRLLILLVGLLLIALLVFGIIALLQVFSPPAEEPLASSAVISSSVSVSTPTVSTPPVSVPAVIIPPVTGEMDVEGIPPLYNRFNAIPQEALDALVLAPAGHLQMEEQAAAAFNAMYEAAAADGITLTPVSGYRNNNTQTTNYNNSIQRYLSSGYSEEEAIRLTEQYYAIPGTSEHEAGLAMDIGHIDDSFANTPAYNWLQENCTQYGFIYRYPQDAVDVTHINWEPWHYRFIGANHALEYERLGMNSLEEYVLYLEQS